MNGLLLDVNLVNPNLHEKCFVYPGDFGPDRPNVPVMQFHCIAEWRDYLLGLQIRSRRVPIVFVNSYNVALRTLLLAWAEPAVIKPAELQALRSLEAGLRDVYFQLVFEQEKAKKPKLTRDGFIPGLGRYLGYMAAHDELPPEAHSQAKRDTGNALDVIRNGLAHGNVFNNLPWGGLFESVREMVEHAFRNHPEPSTYPPEIYTSMGALPSSDSWSMTP